MTPTSDPRLDDASLTAMLVDGPPSAAADSTDPTGTTSGTADIDRLTNRAMDAADRAGLLDVYWSAVDSPVGQLTVVGTSAGLLAVGWTIEPLLDRVSAVVSPRLARMDSRLDPARRQLDHYFAGTIDHFELPIDWALSTPFRRRVLEALVAAAPYGTVITYRDLAARAGSPKASRAVGTAMATNPLAIVVPCHRVLRSDGSLGGYSGSGGLGTKRQLLVHEGVPLPVDP